MANHLIRHCFFGVVAIALCACAQTPSKRDEADKPNLAETYALAAKAYEEQDWKASEKHYLALTRGSPEEVEPWFKLGNVYARTQRFDLAIRCYREALVRDSRYAKAWHNMAVTQLRDAGQSFLELEMLVGEDDPLHEKSVRMRQSIDELVN